DEGNSLASALGTRRHQRRAQKEAWLGRRLRQGGGARPGISHYCKAVTWSGEHSAGRRARQGQFREPPSAATAAHARTGVRRSERSNPTQARVGEVAPAV